MNECRMEVVNPNLPVIFRSQDVCESVPIRILIQESSLFKSLYENKDDSCDQEENQSDQEDNDKSTDGVNKETDDESSTNSDDDLETQNGQDMSIDDTNAQIKVVNENPTEAETDKHADPFNDSVVSNSSDQCAAPVEKIEKLTPQDVQISKNQIDIIDITCLFAESIKTLFGFLNGHPGLMESCQDFCVLQDMIWICIAYDFKNPVAKILERFDQTSVEMSDMIDVLQISENLRQYDEFKLLSDDLFDRCVAYCRCNFASWQVILNFLMSNKAKFGLTQKIFASLKNDSDVIIRRKIQRFDVPDDESFYIIKNLKWMISTGKAKVNGIWYFELNVEVKNPCKSYWSCTADVHLKLVNQKRGTFVGKKFEHKFYERDSRMAFSEFEVWSEVMDRENGFLEDEVLVVEAEIHILEVDVDENEKSEEDITWVYDLALEFQQYQQDKQQNKNTPQLEVRESQKDRFILLTCGGVAVGIKQSVLMKQSGYFGARLNQDWMSESENESDSECQTIKLSGYNPEAFQTVFTYLNGFPSVLETRDSFSVLGEMLRISDYFQIRALMQPITRKIQQLPLQMSCLIDGFKTGQRLKLVPGCDTVGDHLLERCVAFAGVNFASWQYVISFIVSCSNNTESMESGFQILQLLAEDRKCSFKSSLKVPDWEGETCEFIKHNLLWYIQYEMVKNRNPDTNEWNWSITTNLCCRPVAFYENWSCKIKGLTMSFFNHADDTWVSQGDPEFVKTYWENVNSWGFDWTDMDDPKYEFEKDGEILIEVSFEVIKIVGARESLNISEDMIR